MVLPTSTNISGFPRIRAVGTEMCWGENYISLFTLLHHVRKFLNKLARSHRSVMITSKLCIVGAYRDFDTKLRLNIKVGLGTMVRVKIS